jgi:hypothetical protein
MSHMVIGCCKMAGLHQDLIVMALKNKNKKTYLTIYINNLKQFFNYKYI